MNSIKVSEKVLLEKINEAWNWTDVSGVKIERTNDFGNIIIRSAKGKYFRICPEELSYEPVADSEEEYFNLISGTEFCTDWEMENLVKLATEKLGELSKGEKFCLKIPAVIGGEYSKQNIGKISFEELISVSGNLAFQIRDFEEGQKIDLKIV